MPEPARLFVYGTLLPGESNAHVLTGAVRIGPVVTTASFDLVDLGEYPALRAGGHTAVTGELFLVDPWQLAVLDEFEGHPTLFVRGEVALADGGTAQAYLFPADANVPEASALPGGDWRKRGGPPLTG